MAAGIHGTIMPRTIPGLKAGLTLAAHQYKVVKFASTANAVVVVTATTSVAIGVVLNDPAVNEAAQVADDGIVPVIAVVNDLAAGENVGFDSTGRVVDHTTDNRMSIGHALEASTAVGDIVLIQLYGGGSQRY